jgi:hypothetical protein
LARTPPVVAAQAIGLEDIPLVLPSVDLVISSTGSPEVVLTYDGLAEGLRRRRRPLFIVDIAVPRDVDERLAGLDNVFLYNIDDLDRLVARNVERRCQEIPRAEAVVEDEMPLIASVFYNRLAIDMRLQTDPTVQYALGYNAAQGTWWTNPLSADNFQFDSPYNTYLHPGLPPGPISNPGLAALYFQLGRHLLVKLDVLRKNTKKLIVFYASLKCNLLWQISCTTTA